MIVSVSRAFPCAERKPGNILPQFQPYVSHGLESRCCDIKYKCISILHTREYVRHDVTVNSYIFSVPSTALHVSDNVSICTGILPKTHSIPRYAPESNKMYLARRAIRRTAISSSITSRRSYIYIKERSFLPYLIPFRV